MKDIQHTQSTRFTVFLALIFIGATSLGIMTSIQEVFEKIKDRLLS